MEVKDQKMIGSEWPEDEISTRNCRHCISPGNSIYVRCSEGHKLSADGKGLKHNGVVRLNRLMLCCKGCLEFDNEP